MTPTPTPTPTPDTDTDTDTDLPLTGVRVLDLTRLLPGPLATRHLADLGAEVYKIEGPADTGQDDGARWMGQTAEEQAAGAPSMTFRELNRGKSMLRLDLRQPSGVAELLARAREADILIEGFRPGVMARLGLGWDVLHQANPALVVCAISGYGQHGPWAHRAGHDINYIAMAGVLGLIGADGELALPDFQIGDLLGGTQAAVSGVLAALLGAKRTGLGRFVDISMAREVLRHHVLATFAMQASGRIPKPGRELLSGGTPCYGVYRCADGRHLALGALELKFWQSVCDTLGRPEWRDRHWSLGLPVGGEESLAIRAELARQLASQPMAHWAARFDTVDACVTPVLTLDEALKHPALF